MFLKRKDSLWEHRFTNGGMPSGWDSIRWKIPEVTPYRTTYSTSGSPHPCPLCSSGPHFPEQPPYGDQSKEGKSPTLPHTQQGPASVVRETHLGLGPTIHLPFSWGDKTPRGTFVSNKLGMLRDNTEGQSQDHQYSEQKETCEQGGSGSLGFLETGTTKILEKVAKETTQVTRAGCPRQGGWCE